MVSLNDLTQWQEQNLEYLRYEYDLKPSDYVIDIGSYRREWADTIKGKFGCHVECFDALDNRAAWTHNGTIKLGGQYYYTSAFDEANMQDFACVDIALSILNRHVALCKINIEGMEYELIQYIIDNGLIKYIDNLQVQFHLIEGKDMNKMYNDLAERLRETHSITWQHPFIWENWKRND